MDNYIPGIDDVDDANSFLGENESNVKSHIFSPKINENDDYSEDIPLKINKKKTSKEETKKENKVRKLNIQKTKYSSEDLSTESISKKNLHTQKVIPTEQLPVDADPLNLTLSKRLRTSNQNSENTVLQEKTKKKLKLDSQREKQDKDLKILIIGDIHLRDKQFLESEELVSKLINVISNENYLFVIFMGDILHTHGIAKTSAFNLAYKLFSEIIKFTKIYILIGNHDLSNPNITLSKDHFLNPYKHWNNCFVIDEPKIIQEGGKTFTMCPYIPEGKFLEVLSSMETIFGNEISVTNTSKSKNKILQRDQSESENNTQKLKLPKCVQESSCIFAHQEFNGAQRENSSTSISKDKWNSSFPPCISGHIHIPQILDYGVYYVGSSCQVNSDEPANKKIWELYFSSLENKKIELIPIDLQLKTTLKLTYDIEEITKNFNFKLCEKHKIYIILKGENHQFKSFKKSDYYAKLKRNNVIVNFETITPDELLEEEETFTDENSKNGNFSFKEVLEQLISSQSEDIKKLYDSLCDSTVSQKINSDSKKKLKILNQKSENTELSHIDEKEPNINTIENDSPSKDYSSNKNDNQVQSFVEVTKRGHQKTEDILGSSKEINRTTTKGEKKQNQNKLHKGVSSVTLKKNKHNNSHIKNIEQRTKREENLLIKDTEANKSKIELVFD